MQKSIILILYKKDVFMKKLQMIFAIVLFMSVLKIKSMDLGSSSLHAYPELQKFIATTHNPETAQEFLADKGMWRQCWNIKTTINKGPSIDRIENARRMQQVIQDEKLVSLAVASKCLLKDEQIFAKGWDSEMELQDTWIVVAKKVKGVHWMQGPAISTPEVKDLTTFVTKTGYQDFWGANCNVIREARTNKLTFIDTERASFFARHNARPTQLDIVANLQENIAGNIDSQASSWLTHHMDELQKTNDATPIIPILIQPKYNSPDYDFKRAEQEYKSLEGL